MVFAQQTSTEYLDSSGRENGNSVVFIFPSNANSHVDIAGWREEQWPAEGSVLQIRCKTKSLLLAVTKDTVPIYSKVYYFLYSGEIPAVNLTFCLSIFSLKLNWIGWFSFPVPSLLVLHGYRQLNNHSVSPRRCLYLSKGWNNPFMKRFTCLTGTVWSLSLFFFFLRGLR